MASYNDYSPIDVTITPSDAAYTANDVVGGLLTFNMNTTRGFLTGVSVAVGEASIAVPGTVWFYGETPTTSIDDNAAFAPVYADNKKLIGKMLLPTADTLNTRNVYNFTGAAVTGAPLQYWTNVIYAYFVTSGTPDFTGAAQSIGVRLYVVGEV